MSILTTLALMTSAVVAKLREVDPRDAKIAKLKAQVDDLERQLADVERNRDTWREMAEAWRQRTYQLVEARRPQQAAQQAQLLQAQAHQQQMQAALAQQAQPAPYWNQLGQNQASLLGQIEQVFEGFEQFCNCVPARHDLFTRG
jgi:superoxide dismutase